MYHYLHVNVVNLIILYKQFNFGLVSSSNSLPKGQPHLFIFVSPCLIQMNTTAISKVNMYADSKTLKRHNREIKFDVIYVVVRQTANGKNETFAVCL